MNVLLLFSLLAGTLLLSACGSSGSSSPQQSGTLVGNWQFTMAPQTDGNPSDPTYSGGLQGGFLLQQSGAVTGQSVYSVTSSTSITGPCNSGSATITGKLSDSSVTLTAVAGTETFALSGGMLSPDGLMISGGTYTSTVANGTSCGYSTTGSWSAILVPPLTGTITGTFHSASNSSSGLSNQDFVVTGTLLQGQNTGASNATVTGTLSFIDPATNLSDYPCFPDGSVSFNGQISGNTVILQLIGNNGANDGQVGIPLSQVGNATGLAPVTFDSTTNGYVLHSVPGLSYVVNTKACGAVGNSSFIDTGYICLALNGKTGCQQPITISPAALTFPAQQLGSASAPQTIKLTNTSGATVTGLTLGFASLAGNPGTGFSDFTGAANFIETDTNSDPCAVPLGTPITLPSGGSCTLTIAFTPQESCTWMPKTDSNSGGIPPAQCPLFLPAFLNVNNVPSLDKDSSFAVPVTGIGISAIQPLAGSVLIPELDFGAWGIGETHSDNSYTQTLTLTNTSANSLTIPPSDIPCQLSNGQLSLSLTLPLTSSSGVNGLQVLPGTMNATNWPTMFYACDADSVTMNAPTFPISADSCSGTTLPPQSSCTLQITYTPQANTTYGANGADYFLELSTLSCTTGQASGCELDAGRFPVEIKANPASPLRMSPAAGLDFGTLLVGSDAAPLKITLSNDKNDPNAADVTFVGKLVVSGPYSEIDDCPAILTKGNSCTLTITFSPSAVGYAPGSITINYAPEPAGLPQKIFLRGTGQ
jgi:hypothetical protein